MEHLFSHVHKRSALYIGKDIKDPEYKKYFSFIFLSFSLDDYVWGDCSHIQFGINEEECLFVETLGRCIPINILPTQKSMYISSDSQSSPDGVSLLELFMGAMQIGSAEIREAYLEGKLSRER